MKQTSEQFDPFIYIILLNTHENVTLCCQLATFTYLIHAPVRQSNFLDLTTNQLWERCSYFVYHGFSSITVKLFIANLISSLGLYDYNYNVNHIEWYFSATKKMCALDSRSLNASMADIPVYIQCFIYILCCSFTAEIYFESWCRALTMF